MRFRPLVVSLGALVALALVAVPAMGSQQAAPSRPAAATAPDKSPKPSKAPETPITVTGTVVATTDDNGHTEFTLTAGGKTYELEAGPPWWWGPKHPLSAFVGRSVTVAGTIREGSSSIDVETIDGQPIAGRGVGKPPWAGGPKVVGERHPGWKAWKDSGAATNGGHGRGKAGAPGQLKPKPSGPPEADETD